MLARLNAELSRQAQARWLDEHMPALGGVTPREAAADPTRASSSNVCFPNSTAGTSTPANSTSTSTETATATAWCGPITYDTAALRRATLGLA